MTTKTQKWLYGLGSAVITGITTSFLSCLGITGANAVGVRVDQLSYRQVLVITAIGGLVGMAAFLKQSPLPPVEETP